MKWRLCRRAVIILIDSIPVEQSGHIKGLLNKADDDIPGNEQEELLREKSYKVYEKSLDMSLKWIAKLSLKTAGKDSFITRKRKGDNRKMQAKYKITKDLETGNQLIDTQHVQLF